MDFAWVVDALRRGLKVTRKSWPGQRPQYIRITREPGQETIAFVGPDGQTRRWMCSSIDVLATDWEEYVEPKEEPDYITDLPFVMTKQDSHGGKPVADVPGEDHQKPHIGDKKPTFQDLCDDYLEQQKGKVQINKLPFTTTLELLRGESICESWPAVTKVWTTYWDLDIQITGSLVDKADYPYTLCERDVTEQKSDKLVVLAEPGFSQRTVTLHLNENCWRDAKRASASLIHRLTNRFGWNTEFFISLLNGIEHTDGDWCKPCFDGDNRSLGDLFMEDMEFLAQEQARVAHSFYYIINQYLRLVQTTAPERQRRDILAKYEAAVRQHHSVFDGLSEKEN